MVNASEMDPDRSRSSVTMQGRFGHGEFTVAHASHVGCVRRNNEDSVAVHESLGLGIVADGIGGQPGGEVASRRAVHAIARHVASGAGLVDAISLASRDLARAGRRQGNSRPGTTVVATRLVGNAFRVAWVGDSRAYLLADSVVRLTHDHSFVNVLKASGRISDAQVGTHPMRNVLTRALGSVELKHPEIGSIDGQLRPNEHLLLCTDGLHGVLQDDGMHEIVRHAASVESAADALIAATLERGAPDNVSLVLIGPVTA